MPGAFGRTLNLRPATAAAAIDYPFTSTSARSSMADLRVRHDPATGRLVLLDEHGRRLTPAHLGMTSEMLVPPAWSFMIRVFGDPPLPVSLPPSWRRDRDPTAPVRHRPRLRVGSVTLARACWWTRAGQVPVPARATPRPPT